MEKEEIRDIILDTMVVSLEAQLRALKRLRGSVEEDEPREKSMSQTDIVFNILYCCWSTAPYLADHL